MERKFALDELGLRKTSQKFESAVVLLIPALRKYSWRLCRNRSDADDLVQETLCKALTGGHLYNPDYGLKPWLHTIMKNAAITLYRRRTRETLMLSTEFATEPVIAPSQEWAVLNRQVADELLKLSPANQQAIVVISYAIDYREAAEICRCNVGTLKTRVRRAREALAVRFSVG